MQLDKVMGKTIGAALFAAGVAAVWFWPPAKPPAAEAEAVRPVKWARISGELTPPDLVFAARVKADTSRTLAFKQPGRIRRIPVDSGAAVKKGDKLAWIDDVDYKSHLAMAESTAERTRLTYERKNEALKKNAVSREEVSEAEAEMKNAAAAVIVAREALADTVLYAPFDGVISKVWGTELDMVTSSDRILQILNTTKVKIDASFPETIVIGIGDIDIKEDRSSYVTFDALPNRRYTAKFHEYVRTSEENSSQTYTVSYVMDYPENAMLMPGMSATLTIPGTNYSLKASARASGCVFVPEMAVGIGSDGKSFVWVLEPVAGEDGVALCRRREITYAEGGVLPVVKTGLKPGEIVATSGVSLLTEGRKVSLMKDLK